MARKLSHWLAGYLSYTEILESPSYVQLWCGVSTIAAVLQGKCYFDMGFFKWKPGFYIILVGPPGVITKSTSMGIGARMLGHVDSVHFGPSSGSWQALLNEFEEAERSEPMPDGYMEIMQPLHCVVSELGTFLDFDNREQVDVLTDWWDGKDGEWSRHTLLHGKVTLQSPWLNILAGTTPTWLKKHMRESAIGGGFVSRAVWVFGDKKQRLDAYPRMSYGPQRDKLEQDLIHDLREMAKLRGPFKMTDEAYQIGTEWYHDHWENTPAHLREENLQGYVARKQTHLHKLCMVISASKGDNMIIDASTFRQALDFLEATEDRMASTFGSMVDNPIVTLSAQMAEMIRKQEKIKKADLWRYFCDAATHTTFVEALDGLIAAERVRQIQLGEDIYLAPTKHTRKPAPSPDREVCTSLAEEHQTLSSDGS